MDLEVVVGGQEGDRGVEFRVVEDGVGDLGSGERKGEKGRRKRRRRRFFWAAADVEVFCFRLTSFDWLGRRRNRKCPSFFLPSRLLLPSRFVSSKRARI